VNAVHVVEIRDFEFYPAKLNVKVGDTIKWVNQDAVPHTATASDKSWDSGLLANAAEWEMVVSKDSRGDYICTFHPMMKGSISVEN
jgi:plastocyanin